MAWNVKNDMPIGSAMCVAGRWAEKSRFRFSNTKLVYLNTPRRPRFKITAQMSTALRLRASSRVTIEPAGPKNQFIAIDASITNTNHGSPQAL